MQKQDSWSIIPLEMKKFVVKNRQKRRYLKKSEKQSLYSFSKTTYGILPVLIMTVAFMATLVISAPLRNSLQNIKFSFALPQFSLNNPLPFFEIYLTDALQFFELVITFTRTLNTIFNNFLFNTFLTISHIRLTFYYQPTTNFLIDGLLTTGGFISYLITDVVQALTESYTTVLHSVQYISSTINLINNTFNLFIVYLFTYLTQFIVTIFLALSKTIADMAVSSGQVIYRASITLFQILLSSSIIIGHVIFLAAYTIGTWLVFLVDSLFNTIAKIINEIIYVIEIPFKILENFFISMRPYFDILGRHIQMVGSDFTNSAKSFENATVYISSSK